MKTNTSGDQEDTVHKKIPSKGDWEPERSSGYMGYRCTKCGTWGYASEPLRCDCDRVEPKKYKGEIKKSEFGRLLELIDGVKPIVEIWQSGSPAQEEWKQKWLTRARAELKASEARKCKHEYWFRCKCGRPVCRKYQQEYEEK